MKKILFSLFLVVGFAFSVSAQKVELKENNKKAKLETPHSKTAVKLEATPTQKVHNLFSKNKKYKGVKVKHHAKKD